MEIQLRTFDDYLIENPEERVDMIKIDCEGAEMNILEGMKNVLTKNNPQLVVEIHREKLKIFGKTEEDVFNYMKENGYENEIINKVDGGLEEYHVHFYKSGN